MTRSASLLIGVALSVVAVAQAVAHDTGFGHSRRALFVAPTDGGFRIEYRIRLEPEEALLEMTRMDVDGDGDVSSTERDAWLKRRGRELAGNIELKSDGRMFPLEMTRGELQHSAVQVFHFTVRCDSAEVLLEDRNFPHKPGLVRIVAGPGVHVEPAVPTDLSHADRLFLKVHRTLK